MDRRRVKEGPWKEGHEVRVVQRWYEGSLPRSHLSVSTGCSAAFGPARLTIRGLVQPSVVNCKSDMNYTSPSGERHVEGVLTSETKSQHVLVSKAIDSTLTRDAQEYSS